MITYLLQMMLCSSVLYGYYLLFLRDNKFHPYNRFYLLAAVILSFIVPLIKFEWFDVASNNEGIMQVMYALSSQSIDEISITNHLSNRFIDWKIILLTIYLLISSGLLFIIFKRIKDLLALKHQYPLSKMNGFNFISTDIREAPFSFMKDLFWRSDMDLEGEAEKQIFKHELAHIQQKHSWDRIFMQVVKAFFWFNPIYYFIEKELTLIHEYIADEKAIENKDGRAFAAMLLRCSISDFKYSPGQAIFYSSIKKRLKMLTNNKKTKYTYVRKMMALPLLATIIFVVSCQNTDEKNTKDKSVADDTVVTSSNTPAADAVVSTPDKESSYPGDWEDFLRKNLNSDVPVNNGSPAGTYRVVVSFNVDAEGSVSNVKANNDPGYGTAEEAVRAIKASGRWMPAEKDDQKVASNKKQAIVFQVQE